MNTTMHPPVGIDLGTTYSAVASLDQDAKPYTVQNSLGDLITPSALLFEDGEVIVGKEAIKSSVFDPDSYADCFKRDMGAEVFHRNLCMQEIPPEVLSAFVLAKLKSDAERKLGPISRAVITVPAFFDETRRKATQEAGALAGLEVLDIINEPTAAAVAYGYTNSSAESRRIVVYDLGGGTFDVTVLEVHGQLFKALATDGDVRLGGKDFDARIVDYLASKFNEQHGLDPRTNAEDAAQLWIDAQEAKHALSERQKTTVVCYHTGMRCRIELTRGVFEDITRDLVERTETTTSLVVRQAGLSWDDIDAVLLVGGSSRIPMIETMLRSVTGKVPDCSLSADEAIAHGAAIYCSFLMSGTDAKAAVSPGKLINVNSHSLGVVGTDVKTNKKVNKVLIRKNSQLPCRVTKVFPLAKDGQRTVVVPIVEGESHRPEDCVNLGQCVIRDLPDGIKKGTKVEVQYSYAADGRISVAARIPQTRQSAVAEITRERKVKLANLDHWRRQLCGVNDSEAVGDETSDAGSGLSPLDRVYLEIGRLVCDTETCPDLIATHVTRLKETVSDGVALKHSSDQKLSLASKETDSSARIRFEAEGRLLEQQAAQKSQLADQLRIILGRNCVEQRLVIPGTEALVEKARQLNVG